MKEIDLGRGLFAKVDEDSFDELSTHVWYASSRRKLFEAMAVIDGKNIRMHRFIMDVKISEEVDHINMDPLDNRKCNLRIVTKSVQQSNKSTWARSGYKGVYENSNGRWSAIFWESGKAIRLGSFGSKEEAYSVYCEEHLKRRGCAVQERKVLPILCGEKTHYRRPISKYSGERYISYCKKAKKWITCVYGYKNEQFGTIEEAKKRKEEILCVR